MEISVQVDFSKALGLLKQLSETKVKEATAKALNDSAFAARTAIQKNMDTSFDRATAYIRKSVWVSPATPEMLKAEVRPTYYGGKGVDPQKILQAEVFGGSRRLKRSEVLLRNAGVLPFGYVTVPGKGMPADKVDAYGNVKASFLIQLLSYFQSFGEQGFRSNMVARRKKSLAKFGTTRSKYKTINGAVYFVSHGQIPGGIGVHDRMNKTIHLAPGIYSKSGIHGSNVKSILRFVRSTNYEKRLDVFDTPVKAALDTFNRRFRHHLRSSIEGKA